MKCEYIPEIRWCLEWPRDTFMSHEDIWACVHGQESQTNSPTKEISWPHRRTVWTVVSINDSHDGLGCDGNWSDCTPDSDSVLSKHIQMSWHSRPPSSEQSLLPSLRDHFFRTIGTWRNYSSRKKKITLLCTSSCCRTNRSCVRRVCHSAILFFLFLFFLQRTAFLEKFARPLKKKKITLLKNGW